MAITKLTIVGSMKEPLIFSPDKHSFCELMNVMNSNEQQVLWELNKKKSRKAVLSVWCASMPAWSAVVPPVPFLKLDFRHILFCIS